MIVRRQQLFPFFFFLEDIIYKLNERSKQVSHGFKKQREKPKPTNKKQFNKQHLVYEIPEYKVMAMREKILVPL